MGWSSVMTGEDAKTRGEREARQRARRAAAALRENLKRRKAQARARQDGAGASHESAGIAPDKPKV